MEPEKKEKLTTQLRRLEHQRNKLEEQLNELIQRRRISMSEINQSPEETGKLQALENSINMQIKGIKVEIQKLTSVSLCSL
ncbi:MAG: hypothetical protein LBL17_01640 [Coxiellaceae bacterium]|jgi:flagellar biosynthesis chaperone FliJ|nr:hypothetical protein [Coxiellaceae bacterium]